MKLKTIDMLIILWIILYMIKTIFFYWKWDLTIYLLVWCVLLFIKTKNNKRK